MARLARTGTPLVLVLVAALLAAIVGLGVDAARAGSGCPSGTRKFTHVCLETGSRAIQSYADATATCAALKRRLPTFAELDAFRQQPGIDLTPNHFEWTAQPLSVNSAAALSDAGAVADVNTSSLE